MIPVTTSEVICSRCGALNRVRNYDVQKAPVCGRCSGALKEKQSVIAKRAIWRSRKRLAGGALLLSAAAGVAGIALNEQSKPLPSCTVAQPATGRYARFDRSPLIAPLTIRTGLGTNYFIKIEDAGTKRTVMTLFARGGETIEQKMPAGLFKLKYATGDRWCGEQQLFGSETAVNETDKIFVFDQQHTYFVELISQKNGNLPVRSISRLVSRN